MPNIKFCPKAHDKNPVISFDLNGKKREILVFNAYILHAIHIIIQVLSFYENDGAEKRSKSRKS